MRLLYTTNTKYSFISSSIVKGVSGFGADLTKFVPKISCRKIARNKIERGIEVKKILFTGGGTIGHVAVNVALIPEFRKYGYSMSYIGSRSGIERNDRNYF